MLFAFLVGLMEKRNQTGNQNIPTPNYTSLKQVKFNPV